MKIYDKSLSMPAVAADRLRVAKHGTWDGRDIGKYFLRCRAWHAPTGTSMIYTRDVGMHTSGWWKNPDYERCMHLSLSFSEPGRFAVVRGRDAKLTREWVNLFFRADASNVWSEPPYSRKGRRDETWHYRLFCDAGWRPIRPRGEVYTREFTEAGWKSWSDVQADIRESERSDLDRAAAESVARALERRIRERMNEST